MSRSALGQLLSQHQLRPPVARRIVAATGLMPPCLVFEAGAGTGVLTRELLGAGCRVVAVEQDREAHAVLKQRLGGCRKLRLVLGDALQVALPGDDYVVVSNLPFSITAAFVRRLLAAPKPPTAAHLILQREAALKFAGVPRETQFSVLAKVDFDIQISLALHRADFMPRPAVDSVLLSLRRRPKPLVQARERAAFETLVRQGFGRGKGDLRRNLGRLVDYYAFREFCRARGLSTHAAPSELAFDDWLGLFRIAKVSRRP